MKHLLVMSALLAAAVAHGAAWERLGVLQSAGRTGRLAASVKIGQLACHENVGKAVAELFSELPSEGLLGPMRPGDGVSLALFRQVADGAPRAKGGGDDPVGIAALCPVQNGPEAFREAHPACVETNGCLLVETSYVGFSPDGRWAATSDEPELVRRTLAERPVLTAFDTNSLFRFCCNAKWLRCLAEEMDDSALSVSKGLVGVEIALGVGDKGLDVTGAITVAKGSELDRCGRTGFAFDPFSRVGTNDLFVAATAAKALGERPLLSVAEVLRRVFAVCRRHGIDLSPFRLSDSNGVRRLVLDGDRFAGVLSASSAKLLAKAGDAAFARDLEAALERPVTNAVLAAQPEIFAFSVTGYETEVSPGERFQLTIPEVAGKRPFAVSILSLSGLANAVSPCIAALFSEQSQLEALALAGLVPEEAEAGIASMYWRDGDRIRFLLRISGDELFGIAGVVASLCGIPTSEADEDLSWEDGEEDADEEQEDDAEDECGVETEEHDD